MKNFRQSERSRMPSCACANVPKTKVEKSIAKIRIAIKFSLTPNTRIKPRRGRQLECVRHHWRGAEQTGGFDYKVNERTVN